MSGRANGKKPVSEAGMSIVFIALGLVALLGIAGLGVDLATLYVARNEAQRAADSAALAGAQQFVETSYLAGNMTASQVQAVAASQASQVGNQNYIIGRSPDLQTSNFNSSCPAPTGSSGGCFDFSVTNDPRITVNVQSQMPTYFMRALGVQTITVSATATAEAFTPTNAINSPAVSATCLKPWLLPNCDSDHPASSDPSEGNTICAALSGGSQPEYFVDPNTNSIVNPGLYPTGVVGEPLTIKPGQPNDAPTSSKFWPVFLPAGSSVICPTCAASDQLNGGSNSAALYRENIECCSTNQITCGQQTVSPISGNMVGPTSSGVDCLIHEGNQNTGQDTISLDSSYSPPFQIYAGANNPYYSSGTAITTSDSLVTLPLYDGQSLCPGGSCPSTNTVTVVGFIQLFLKGEYAPQGTVDAYVVNVAVCNTASSGTTPVTIPGQTNGTPIPIRLIHN